MKPWEIDEDAFMNPDSMDPNDELRLQGSARDDTFPYDKPVGKNVWESIMEELNVIELGPQGASATPLGYGNHGRMGEDGMDALDLEIDSLQKDFRDSYEQSLPTTISMHPKQLFSLLHTLDPDFSAETFAPEDEEEMRGIYSLWADRMSGLEEEPDEDQNY